MEMKLKKLWPLIGAMCVSLFGSAFADSYQYNSSSQSNGNMQQSQSGQGTYQRGAYREITPNAGPRVAHGADVFITADFIWWKAVQDGMNYALTGIAGPSNALPAFTNAPRGREHVVGQDWAPGFKVGLGLNLSHDGWDLYAQYTWLHASDNSSVNTSNATLFPGGVVAEWFGIAGQDGPFVIGNRASANWDLHFNVIDLELGRNFYLSQFLTMRPFIGLKGTWQDQHTRIRITADQFTDADDGFHIDDAAGNIAVTGPYRRHDDVDTWGIGVRGGFNIAWYMAKSWSIYGDLAWTAMWTDYHQVRRRDHLDDTTTGTSTLVVNFDNNNYYAVKYVGELELGLRWETWFYDDNYHFAIQAGWEEQVWINWTHFAELLDYSQHDLSFHGLNLKLRFDF